MGGEWPPSVSAARSYLARRGVTYPVVRDPNSSLARSLAIQGIPSTVIIDSHDRVRFRILGRVKPGDLQTLIGELH